MTRINGRRGVAALALLGLVALGGCQSRIKDERDALWQQNKELQAELDRARAEKAMADSEIARLQASLDAARFSAPAPASANTGFSTIPGVETTVTAGAITVKVPGDVLFASGKVDLKSTAQQTLNQIASVINRDYASNTIRIEGYTDTDPIKRSSWADNLELSLQRAAAVHRYLQKQGVSPQRMYAAGFGEHRPRDSKATSRRVEIVVVLNE